MNQTAFRFVEILDPLSAGGVLELCVFKNGRPSLVGYYEDYRLAAREITAYSGSDNLFVTANPCVRALCGRAYNKLIHAERRVKDEEIVCFRNFVLDIDPDRPSGVSSTDGEWRAAIDAGRAIKDFLIAKGVPDKSMLTATSGNGAYLIVRTCDYPNTDEYKDRLKAVINYLADLFETPGVKIDRSVFNPSRVIAALGSKKKKGDPDFTERPHRDSAIFTVGGEKFDPDTEQSIEPCDLLAIIAPYLPEPEPPARWNGHGYGATKKFDMRDQRDRLRNEKTTTRGFAYYDCPHCGGNQKLHVNENTGAYSCFHGCTPEAIRESLGVPKGRRPVIHQPEIALQNGSQKPESECEGGKSEPWEPPAAFHEFSLPAFPVKTFAPWLRSYVEGLAQATQTPPDLAAMIALAACAAAVARNTRIQARRGWTEPLNIYAVAVLPPANRKTQVQEEVTQPLQQYERELTAEMSEKIAEAASERRILEARQERAEKDCAKLEGAELEEAKAKAKELSRELAEFHVPPSPQLIVDDVTSEALATLLLEQGGRIALFSAEGGIFDVMAGRYSNGAPNIDVYLKGHAGDQLRINRRGRAEHVEKPALTIGLAVQPEVLRGLAGKPGFRGRGLIGRILYSLPHSNLGRRKIRPAPLSEEARNTYTRNLKQLASLCALPSEDGEYQPRLIRLSKDADERLAVFEGEIELQLADGGDLAAMGDWAGKLAGAVLRIAGILHLAEHVGNFSQWPEIVSAETFERAVTIGRYLIPHAKAAYAEMGADPKVEEAKYVLRWIERSGLTELTKRDAYQGTKGRFKKVTELEPAISLLEEHGYIRPLPGLADSRPGRKPSRKYAVNPLLNPIPTIPTIPTIQPATSEQGDCEDSGNYGDEHEEADLTEPHTLAGVISSSLTGDAREEFLI